MGTTIHDTNIISSYKKFNKYILCPYVDSMYITKINMKSIFSSYKKSTGLSSYWGVDLFITHILNTACTSKLKDKHFKHIHTKDKL